MENKATMAVVENFKSASIFGKLAFLLLSIASLFIWIAFTCTGWGESNQAYDGGLSWGLWRRCEQSDFPSANCFILDGWANGWWGFTQAASCFGFMGILISFVLVILYIFVSKCQKNSEVAIATAVICFVTGSLQLIGCIVFGAKWNEHFYDRVDNGVLQEFWLSYAFGLAIVAALIELAAGLLLVLEYKKIGITSVSG